MEREIEITEFPKEDYAPLVSYEGWRVAALAHCENTKPESIQGMQRHEETDEVFVLVRGGATLITAGCGEQPGTLSLIPMENGKAYNVKRNVWHNHVLDEDGVVVIVENADTCDENSPIIPLKVEQRKELLEKLWQE